MNVHTSRLVDRILWNSEDENNIDEIVLHGVTVHVEQMDDRCWWIGIYRDGTYWTGNFVADRGRMRFSQQENAGIEWDHIRDHNRPSTLRAPCSTPNPNHAKDTNDDRS